MATFGAWQFSDLVISGPDPFGSDATANSSSVNNTTFTIKPTASVKMLTMVDNEGNFEDGDASQDLAGPLNFNGVNWPTGEEVENQYSYVIRPLGSSNPADNITIYVLEFNGNVHGIASSQRLFAGQSYRIVAEQSNSPSVPYSSMAVCFAAGTLIETAQGLIPVERLRRGMRVQTADNGFQPVRWIGRRRMPALGAQAMVRVEAGVLGNSAPLYVSGQHRLLIRPEAGALRGEEVLVAAKALVGREGVRFEPRISAHWLHFMCPRHEVVFANGAQAETFLPGPEGMAAIDAGARAELERVLGDGPPLPARAILPAGRMARMRKRWGAKF